MKTSFSSLANALTQNQCWNTIYRRCHVVTTSQRGQRAKYEECSTGLSWGVCQPNLSLILAGITRDLNDRWYLFSAQLSILSIELSCTWGKQGKRHLSPFNDILPQEPLLQANFSPITRIQKCPFCQGSHHSWLLITTILNKWRIFQECV